MRNIYFLTYDDETGNYTYYTNQLVSSVKYHSPSINTLIYPKSKLDSEFTENYKAILEQRRGGGYWLWKPKIILDVLQELEDDDILIYLDSMYLCTHNLIPLFDKSIENTNIMVFTTKPKSHVYHMRQWCKMDVIQKYNMADAVFNKNITDCWAGFLIFKKNSDTVAFVEEWLKMCCIGEDITDSPSTIQNAPEFIDHRHDQSMLRIMCHKKNIPLYALNDKYIRDLRRDP
jgi:hypothetical protein